jgi:hypothetical protein
MASVVIRGQGVAACCCAHLLDAAGFSLALRPSDRPTVPALLIGEATQHLICDVFGRPDVFAGLPCIEQRVVAWGPGAKPVTLPHRAVVISEDDLGARIGPRRFDGESDAGWQIHAARPLPASCVERPFGMRTATAQAVALHQHAAACWIESVTAGWLFLISSGGGTGWLLSVGGALEPQLAESRLVAPLIQHRERAGATFPAYPRIATPLCGPGWLNCGAAAISFDPLSGDGVGYAVREGILAAAVIRAIEGGGDAEGLRAHYAMRVVAGFRRHLELCRPYYRTGGDGPWWQRELELLEQGIEWCRCEQAGENFRYRLNGFELQPAG